MPFSHSPSHGAGQLSGPFVDWRGRAVAEGDCHKHRPEWLFQHVVQDGSAEAPPPGREWHSVALSTGSGLEEGSGPSVDPFIAFCLPSYTACGLNLPHVPKFGIAKTVDDMGPGAELQSPSCD